MGAMKCAHSAPRNQRQNLNRIPSWWRQEILCRIYSWKERRK